MKRLLVRLLLPALAALILAVAFSLRQSEPKQPPPSLHTHPYLIWHDAGGDSGKRGVTRHNVTRTGDGLYLYQSRDQERAHLMDARGRIVHSWEFPGLTESGWHVAHPYPHGDLLVVVKDRLIMRLTADSQRVWSLPARVHHDVTLDSNGDILTLGRRDAIVQYRGENQPVLEDTILVISGAGKFIAEIPLWEFLREYIYPRQWEQLRNWRAGHPDVVEQIKTSGNRRAILKNATPPDMLHCNTLTVVTARHRGLCDPGDLLICSRELDMVAIISRAQNRVVWSWGQGILQKPHHPSILENGHILVFDNGSRERGYSRILELDPASGRIVWRYQAAPPQRFFTAERGSCQRLPNGNTLITESNRGRVFEINGAGEIQWEFYNPRVVGNRRAAIYRMTLFPRDYFTFPVEKAGS